MHQLHGTWGRVDPGGLGLLGPRRAPAPHWGGSADPERGNEIDSAGAARRQIGREQRRGADHPDGNGHRCDGQRGASGDAPVARRATRRTAREYRGRTPTTYQPADREVALQNSEACSLVVDRLPSITGYRITVKPLIDQPPSVVSRLKTNVSSASA